jgi:integrase
MTRQAVNYLIAAVGRRAKLGHVHPHMLRHSCGTRSPTVAPTPGDAGLSGKTCPAERRDTTSH